jgi:hypothetical protein
MEPQPLQPTDAPCFPTRQKSDLAELDAWYLTSLPTLLRAREPEPHMEKQELQRLMEWKLKKGKWCVDCCCLLARKHRSSVLTPCWGPRFQAAAADEVHYGAERGRGEGGLP